MKCSYAKNILNFYAVLFSLIFTTVVKGQVINKDSIDTFIIDQMKRHHIPGISACVIKEDGVVWSKAYGYANIEQTKLMSTENILNIGSISKTVTATAIMQLWELGKLKLNEDVNTYLDFPVRNPNFPNSPITINQLLTHTSSIADGAAYKLGYACGDPETTLKNWLYNYFSIHGTYYDASDNFHNQAPDSLREYSNIGFGLLGLIVEEISEMPFNKYVKKNIFLPLMMTNSGYFLDEIDQSKLATSYLYLGPLQQNLNKSADTILPYYNPYCHYSFWNYPDGLVRTSVTDLAKFAAAYMNDGLYGGARILKKETIDMMMSPQLSEKINADKDQGLSWFLSQGLYPSWFHGGSDPGVSARMYINRKDKISVIVCQNANKDNAFYIIKELYKKFE